MGLAPLGTAIGVETEEASTVCVANKSVVATPVSKYRFMGNFLKMNGTCCDNYRGMYERVSYMNPSRLRKIQTQFVEE